MELRKSERKKAKIKMAIQGCSGSGKTYSSLLIAKGLTQGDYSKVAIIDAERSADLYAHIGEFNVLTLEPPFSPDKFIKAIDLCIKKNMEVIIIDSASKVWTYLLNLHSQLEGKNSFIKWNKITPLHNAFVDKILEANVHIISTMRAKQEYVLNQINGKVVPEKIGLKAIQRSDIDFEFSLVFNIDSQHLIEVTKNRTTLFKDKVKFIANSSTGLRILEWCERGISQSKASQIVKTESVS